MNIKEICAQYGVSRAFCIDCIEAGILGDLSIVSDELGEEAVGRLESCICLHSLGLDVKTIKRYIFLERSDKDTRKERIEILQKHRKDNLENVHKTKKVMDCIDCVLHELKKDPS